MPELDADIAVKVFNAIVLPLIVAFNVHDRRAPRSALSRYMWTRQPLLWSLGLIFLSVLALMSIVEVASWLGWLPAAFAKGLVPLLGGPMLLLSIAVLVLSTRAALQAWRGQ